MSEENRNCRLCLSEDQLQVSLFSDYSVMKQLTAKIESCLQQKVHDRDPYSEYVCYKCVDKLESFEEFKTEAARAQKPKRKGWEDLRRAEIRKPPQLEWQPQNGVRNRTSAVEYARPSQMEIEKPRKLTQVQATLPQIFQAKKFFNKMPEKAARKFFMPKRNDPNGRHFMSEDAIWKQPQKSFNNGHSNLVFQEKQAMPFSQSDGDDSDGGMFNLTPDVSIINKLHQ